MHGTQAKHHAEDQAWGTHGGQPVGDDMDEIDARLRKLQKFLQSAKSGIAAT